MSTISIKSDNHITNYTGIKINPIFEPIKKIFEFFILGIVFIGQKDFQKIILQIHPYFESLINTYNKEVDLKIEKGNVKSNNSLYWIDMGRLMAIAIFDVLQFSKYHNKIKNTEIFKFTKYIRNGAAHNNKFNLKSPLKKQICWRNKIINNSLNNTEIFPGFMNPMTLIFLMSDLSKTIKEKQKNRI